MSNPNAQFEASSAETHPALSQTLSRQVSLRYIGCVVPAMVLAFALRIWGLSSQSLTTDELYELRFVTEGVRGIVFQPNGFPPLYPLLLHCWLQVFPVEEAARWLSALLGLVSILFAWRLACRIGGREVGLWTLLLLAVSPFHIYYCQEARGYALYYTLAALALWLFLRALESDRVTAWLMFVFTASTGIYAYYFGMVIVTAGLLFTMKPGIRKRWRRGLGAFGGILILSLPAAWLLHDDLAAQASYSHQVPFDLVAFCYTCLVFVTGFTIGPSMRELHTMPASQAVLGIVPWALVIGIACIALACHGLHTLRANGWLGRLLVLAVVPLLAVGIVGQIAGVGYNVRYVIWCALPVTIWAAAGITRGLTRPTIALSLAILLAVSAVAIYNRRCVNRYKNEDVKSLAAYLQSLPDGRLPVFVMADYMQYPVRHYLDDNWAVYPLPYVGMDRTSLDRALATIVNRLPESGSYWLVYTRAFHGDPQDHLRKTLLSCGAIHPRATFPGIVLYRGNWIRRGSP